jgi:hypothetical protein
LAEHQQHLDEKIGKLVNRMYEIADIIKSKEKDIDLKHKSTIPTIKSHIYYATKIDGLSMSSLICFWFLFWFVVMNEF